MELHERETQLCILAERGTLEERRVPVGLWLVYQRSTALLGKSPLMVAMVRGFPGLIAAVALAIAFAPNLAPAQRIAACAEPSASRAYAGRFGLGAETSPYVLTISVEDSTLVVTPAMWSGRMALEPVARDSFVAVQYGRPAFAFVRDENGCVVGVRATSLRPDGVYRRLSSPLRAIEMILADDPLRAATTLFRVAPDSAAVLAASLTDALITRPSLAPALARFAQSMIGLTAPSVALTAAAGRASLAAGDRKAARQYFTVAARSHDSASTAALERLDSAAVRPRRGWELPFSLDSLFARPTKSEINQIRKSWRLPRQLFSGEGRIIRRDTVHVAHLFAEARTIEHRVDGQRHVGVVLVPLRRTAKCCAVIAEAREISWNFPPLGVPSELTTPWVMADRAEDFIYVVPAFRGEALIVAGDTLRAEGDPRNGWTGASDDFIAFLHTALALTPEADGSRTCAYGRSRGGTIALLAGIRDSSIDCVVSWAAPTDWLTAMTSRGWTPQEIITEALYEQAPPNSEGGQRVDVTMRRAIEGRETLEDVRWRLISASPAYFAARLPLTQAHWALDDGTVSSANGRRLVDAWRTGRKPSWCLEAIYHPRAGHDQDRISAPVRSRAFLIRALAKEAPDVKTCR